MKKTIAAAAALVLASSVMLTGCKDKNESATPTQATSSTKVSAAPLSAVPSFQGTPGGYMKDVKILSCNTDQGMQEAKGTVENTGSEALDYSILVMWLKNGDSTPYANTLVVVKGVKPGEKREWQGKAEVPTKVDVCWPQVLGGKLA